MNEALIIAPTEALEPMPSAYISPVISLERALANHAMLKQYVSQMLTEGHDFGVIPGTGSKPSLLKPGAEKLTTIFGLTKRFAIVQATEDWDGSQHNGEPFFYYIYRCSLWKGDLLIAESDGSCNSFESKYRYRKADRLCPDCAQPSIIRGKEEWGGGWLCYKNKGGCGAKFGINDPAITAQQVGRVVNPDIADQINTIQKMGQKRALIGTTLLAVNASEFFTQDIEDFNHEPPTGTDGGRPAQQQSSSGHTPDPQPRNVTPMTSIAKSVAELATPKQLSMIRAMAHELELDPDAETALFAKQQICVGELSRKGASSFIDHLKGIIAGTSDQLTMKRRAGSVHQPMTPIRPVEEAPTLATTKPVGVPNLPAEMGLAEFKTALEIVKPKLPGWRFREVVQEFVMVEDYQPDDELDAIERDRGPMIQKLNDESRFFIEKEQRAAERKTSTTFWKRVGELQVGREFGVTLINKWTKDKQTDWTAAQAELERSAADQMAA